MADKIGRVVFSRNLGEISYLRGIRVQNALAKEHLDYINNESSITPQNTLILCEHSPVYTTGIRNNVEEEEKARLEKLGAEFHFTNRGGLITFHGPGQLMCYPVLNLVSFKKSIRWYIGQLEDVLLKTCRKLGVDAHTTCDTGVWVRDKKIAAIGVRVSRWVTTHGIALNCNNDPRWFDHIVPCGIVGKGVTSLSKETNHNIAVGDAVEHFLTSFSEVFECEVKALPDQMRGDEDLNSRLSQIA